MGKEIILWPEYFSNSLSRRRGRRVNRKLSRERLVAEELLNACKKLGYECRAERGKKYPSLGIRSLNYRLVIELPNNLKIRKNELIKKLAEALQKKDNTAQR